MVAQGSLYKSRLTTKCNIIGGIEIKESRLMFVKTLDILLIIDKKGSGVYIHSTKSLYAQIKAKAKEQRFYCYSSSQNHSEVFNMEQTLISQQVQDGP